MTLFEQLRERYTDFDAAWAEQMTLLISAAENMTSGLGGYLGLPTPCWHHEDGKAGDKYIRLGKGSGEDFEETQNLTGSQGVVSFSLALVVDSPSAHRERFTFVFEYDLKFCETGYLFQIKLIGDVVVSAANARAGRFEQVYNAMLEALHQTLDPSRILIQK
ncbi:hypothetical protein [Pseudomonas frederiksbergensis]|uniref:hypothetical protein n=1 Tax=Pseudomonas frederiksbergensis TaxID=104087 RepID=UPI003D954927